jgi:N12 class adenine-specific DNA methylase
VPISKTFASYFTAGPTTFPDNSLQDEEDLPVTPASKLPEFQTKIPDVETLPQPDVGGKKVSADFASYFKPALSPTPQAAAPQQPLQPEPDVSPAAALPAAAPPQQEQPLQPATSGFPITPEMARREGERGQAEDPFNVGVSAVLNFAGNVLKGAGTAAKKQTEKLESENKPTNYWDLQLLQKGIKSGQGLVDYSKEILPDEARIRSLGDKIKRIDESAPGIATSFKMGDVAGAIDGAYFDVALSGSEKANAEMRQIKAQYDQMSAKKEIESELQGRNWFMKTVDATAQMLALMGKSIVMSKIPVIGQTLSTSMWARQGAGEMLARFDKENIPRDVGIPVATIAGVAYAMIEQVELRQLTNIGARKNLGQALWNRVENLTKEKSVDWVKENFEEVAQGLIEEAAYDIAAGLSGKQKEKVDEIAKRYVSMVGETLKQTAGPMGLLTLLGFGAGAANIALNRKTAEQQPGAESAATTTAPLPPPPPVPAAAAPAATGPEQAATMPPPVEQPAPEAAGPPKPQPPATPEPQPAAAPTAEPQQPQPPEPQSKPVKTVSPEFQKALSAPAAVPPASEPKPSNQVRNKKELEQWEQLRAQPPEEGGKMLASAGIRTDEFYRLDPQKQQEIFDKLTDDEQEQVLEFEPPAVTTIEEIRNRVNEVDRDEEEKKEIANVELQPSEGQKTAGNYRKGHVQKGPFDVSIENPAGSERTGVDRSGKRWSQEINHDYGYIRGTKGADAFRTKDGTDQLDVFIKPDSDVMARPVYVINQVDPQTQRFDEHKVMMGFDSEEEARIAYLSNYEPNWKGLGSIHKMPMKKFEQWAYSEETKYPYKPGKKEAAAAEEIAPKKSDEEKGRALAAQIPGVTFLQSGGGTMRKGAVETEPLLHFNDEVSGSTRTIKPTEGLEELKKTIAEARKGVQTHGKENIAGVPGKKRKGKEPIVAGSDLGAGEKTAAAGGVLQTQKEVAPSPAHQKPSKAELAKIIFSYRQKLHDGYYNEAIPEETEEQRKNRIAQSETESKELAADLIDAIEEKDFDKLTRMIEINKANRIGFIAYTGEKLPASTNKALEFIKEYLNRQKSVERSAYKKTETRPARKENETIRPSTPAEPSPEGPPAAPEKKELTLKERARKRFEEKQAARKNKEPTAEEKIALEKEKRDEALRRASDALRRLGESFGNRDPNTLYSIGTQQADIAFEAVSALVEAGYHEFRAMSIKISELAKQYIGIKGFRDAIEDAYDAYAEEDATVEKRTVSIDEILKQEEKTGILEKKGKEETDELAKTPPTKLVAKPPENVPPAGERGEADLNAAPGGGGNGEPHRRTGGKRGHLGGSAGKGPEAVPSPIRKRRPGTRGTEPGPNSTVNGGRTDQRLNYHIVNEDNIGKGGPKEKVRNNLAALKTLLKIESENRRATPEEQQILVKYVGWGAFPKVFDAKNHEGWDAEYDELKALLSASDYDAAETSTVNAHYTSPEIVRGMWEAMRWMGFNGGPVFEPGCGIGHFFGLMPQDINATYTGIEMDSLSARIAQQLYQSSNIHEKSFENYSLAENRYTIAIGNVPFSNKIFPYDKESKRYGLEPRRYALHDFFILKTLYGLKPGGVAAFITSRYTMDKTDTEVRRKIAESADFIGAIRLPGKAFKDNAGTDVVTDIVFLRKRAPGVRMSYLTMGFIKTEEREFDRVKGEGKKIEHINRFLNMHPELILGTEDLSGTMYTSDQYNVVLPIEQLPDKLAAAIKLFSQHGIRVASEEKAEIEDAMAKALAPNAIPIGGYYLEDGVIFQKTSETEGVPAKLKGQQADRVKGMIPIKSAIRRLLSVQYESDDDGKLTPHFKSLNAAYDAFVNKYGYLHQRANVAAIEDDPDGALLLALENWDRDTKVAVKADIFTKRTLRRASEVQRAGNALEAMLVSQSEKGGIDWNYMARLTGSEIDALRKDLLSQEQIFVDATGFLRGDEDVYVPRDEYLSGNVREKLKDARKAAEKQGSFQHNVAALEKVIPADLAPTDIFVRLNSPILSENDLIDFLADTFDMYPNRIELSHSREMGRFYFKYNGPNNPKITVTYGIDEVDALKIFEHLLNSKQLMIWKEGPDRKKIIDTEKTDQAKAKAEAIVEAFNNWIWKDAERTKRIARDYNDVYNAVVDQKIIHPKRAIDPNAQVTFPGCTYTMRPHQADAIWRQIKQKNVLLAHTVGAGKTLEMICAGMELKRLGLRKKPLYVVPNHLVEQWAIAFRQAYPGARVLVATDKNFKPEQRKEFLNRIAMGNWDAVIVKQSNFLRISLDEEVVERYVKEKISVYKNALRKAEEQNEKRTKIKDLKARIKNYEARLKKLMDSAKDVGVVPFEQLGVDQLFIDEFDMYKNLDFFSNRKVLGLGSQKGAEKSFDLGMKIDYIQNLGGGVVGGTGTPISNSMAETYHMMRYLQPEILQSLRLVNFDEWANMFAQEVTSWELNNSGSGYKLRTRFSKFSNIPELMHLLRMAWDIQTADMLEKSGILVRGKNLPNVQFRTISAPATKALKSFIGYLSELEKNAREIPGGVLKIIGMGRHAAVDMRLIAPSLPDDPDYKLNMAAEKVAELLERYPTKTGLVFYDLTRPDPGRPFDPHGELKRKIVAKGFDEKTIAFIHDFDTDAKKLLLFDQVNSGRVRVLIGSTEKMGAGTNVQKILKWLIHIDAPWRPRDIEQREGRIIRQGNSNDEVEVYRFVSKGSYDIALWNLLDIKAKVIRQIMSGEDNTTREIEDDSSFSNVMLMAIDNPLVKESMELDQEVRRLTAVRKNWQAQSIEARAKLQANPVIAKEMREKAAGARRDLAKAGPRPADFSIKVHGVTYDDRKLAGEAIIEEFKKLGKSVRLGVDETDIIGEFAGMPFFIEKRFSGSAEGKALYDFEIVLQGENQVYRANGSFTPHVNGVHLTQIVWDKGDGLEARAASFERRAAQLEKTLDEYRLLAEKPFEDQEKLETTQKRLADVLEQLRKDNEKQAQKAAGEEPDQYNWAALEQKRKQNVDEDGEDIDTPENTTTEISFAPEPLPEGKDYELAEPDKYYALLRKPDDTVSFDLIDKAKPMRNAPFGADIFYYKDENRQFRANEGKSGLSVAGKKNTLIALENSVVKNLEATGKERFEKLIDDSIRGKATKEQRGLSPRYRIKGEAPNEEEIKFAAGEESENMPLEKTSSQIETPEFKKWAENAPVVKLKEIEEYEFETGKPVVAEVLHGSDRVFTEFKKEELGSSTYAQSAKKGFFFTNSPDVAAYYPAYDKSLLHEYMWELLGERPSWVPLPLPEKKDIISVEHQVSSSDENLFDTIINYKSHTGKEAFQIFSKVKISEEDAYEKLMERLKTLKYSKMIHSPKKFDIQEADRKISEITTELKGILREVLPEMDFGRPETFIRQLTTGVTEEKIKKEDRKRAISGPFKVVKNTPHKEALWKELNDKRTLEYEVKPGDKVQVWEPVDSKEYNIDEDTKYELEQEAIAGKPSERHVENYLMDINNQIIGGSVRDSRLRSGRTIIIKVDKFEGEQVDRYYVIGKDGESHKFDSREAMEKYIEENGYQDTLYRTNMEYKAALDTSDKKEEFYRLISELKPLVEKSREVRRFFDLYQYSDRKHAGGNEEGETWEGVDYELRPNVQKVFVKLLNPLVHDYSGEGYRDTPYTKLVDEALQNGHDGVIMVNTLDPYKTNIFVVFEPTQIKSATGNRGTFAPENPDVTFAGGESEFKIEEIIRNDTDEFWKTKKIKTVGYRYGDIPHGGRSYNNREQKYENGVSLVGAAGLPPKNSFAISDLRDKKTDIQYLAGEVIKETGGDDEFLMTNPEKISKETYDKFLDSVEGKKSKAVLSYWISDLWARLSGQGYVKTEKYEKHEAIYQKALKEYADSLTGKKKSVSQKDSEINFAAEENVGGESEPTGKSGQFENRYVNPLEERLTTLLFRQAKMTAVPGSVRTVAPPQSGPQADLKRALELATGKEVVLIETDPIVMTKAFGHTVDGFSIPGAVSPEIAGKIFIDVNSGRPVKWTAFHELWHFIENDPELSKRFWDTVTLTDKGKTVLARRGKSEFAADIVGEMMARPDFLQNMAREDEGAFRKIINKLRQILSKLASALRRAFGGAAEKTKLPAKYEAFIANIEEVRNAVAGIYADFKSGAQMESVPQRLAAAMGQAKEEQPLFAKGRPTRLPLLPKTIPLPTPEQIAEAKANATLDEERVKAIENEMAKLRGKLRHLPKEQLRERAEISLKIQGDIAARLWEIRNAIYEYAKKIGLKGVPYNKVDLMMKNADTLGKMKKAMERLDNVWLQYSKSVAVQQVLDLVDVTYRRLKKIEAGKLRSTVPGEYNDRLKEYLDALSSQPDWYKGNDYSELVRKMLNYYNLYAETDIKRAENVSDLPYDIVEWMQDPTKPVPDNMRKMIRELFNRNLVTMSTDQLETVVKDIDSIYKVGRTVLEQREAERKEALNLMAIEQAQNIRAASKDIEGDPLDQALGNKRLTRMEWLKKLSEKFAWSFIDPERMVEWLTGWKGFNGLKEAVLKPFYRAEAVKLKNVALANEKFLERHKNVDWRTVLTQTFMTVDMKGIYALAEVKMLPKKYQKEMVKKVTLDNAMFIYANSLNAGNLAHLRGLFINNEVADIFIEEVITKLPQEYRDIVDAQIAYYDNEQYPRVSAVFERDHMIALPKEKWYFPIQNLLTDRAESALVADYLARFSSHWAGVQKGMTKVRVHSKAPFRKMSYFGTVTSNMQQVEHYIAYNDAVREVNRFLHHDAIKSAITNRSEEVYKQLLEWVKAVAYGRVSGSEHVYDKIFDFLRKNFTTYALGLKLTTALMQLTSLPKGMAMINKADVARSCMAYLMDPKAAEKHANELSAMMANREHSYERELAEMFEKQAVREYAGISTLSDKAKRALMWHIGRVDKIIATVLWNAKFDEQMHIHGNETAAAEAADEMIRKTQSRGGVLYMPSIYRGGGLVRAMTIFTSDLNQNINLLFELQGKWKFQPSTKNVHDVFWSFAIPTTMIWMINNAFIPAVSAVKNFIDPDEPEDFRLEEWMKELISQFTGGVAFLGPIFDAAIGMAADSAKELRGIIPDKRWKRFVGDMSPAGVDVIEELVRGFADKNPEALFDAIAIATGYPYRTVRRAVTGAVEVARGGGAKAAAGMIWSRRQLRDENIYDSMARRLYKPRPKSDDFERYAKWYKGLDKSEQRTFQKYTREWYKRKMLK